MKTIHELAKVPGNETDKQNADHSFHGCNYLHYYDKHFSRLREQPVSVLEIGVCGGYSLRLWRDYFATGHVHGIDIDPWCEQIKEDRMTVHIGDQSDTKFLIDVADKAGPFDIVIDDGSHAVEHLIVSLNCLWSSVKPGGIYAMEDLRVTYHGVDRGWPGMSFNTTAMSAEREEFDKELLFRIKTMDNLTGDIASIHFYPMVCILEKISS